MKEIWDNRLAFILAAIGSAIGLGNIWRFPYIAYRYGGGAFLIPYLVALFTAGIPLLILEFTLGHKTEHGAPLAFGSYRKNWKWLGWFAIAVAFGIVAYYTVIMSWSFIYFFHSFSLSWGNIPELFFNKMVLEITDSPFNLGGINYIILIFLIVTWIAIYYSIYHGVKTVGKVVYVTVILPWLILLVLIIRGITLPGALEGLSYYLTPNFAALKDPIVWINAYAQIFFTLSVGLGIMIAYSSYLPRKADIVNNAFIIGFANCFTSFLAGIAVFSSLGFLAYQTGKPVSDVVASGPGLAFVAYPTIINMLPFANKIFGALFFMMLLTLGIDSAFSLVEAASKAALEQWKKIPRRALNLLISIIAIIVGLIFSSRGGLYWLDIIDHYICCYGLVVIGFLEAIFIGYFINTKSFHDYMNKQSEIIAGKWWLYSIKIVVPVVLLVAIVYNTINEFRTPYEGYPKLALNFGFAFILLLLIISILLSRKQRRL
ncbi:sodium-dependent transporter [candidate division WOR-3 bacterium]|nr:sodium-dependent transporter [candidate division WOR-3 bacterium]